MDEHEIMKFLKDLPINNKNKWKHYRIISSVVND